MKAEQTEERFMSIVEDSESPARISYHKTATEAVQAAGCPPWNWFFQMKAAFALEPGDELSLTSTGSVIRLTGKDVDYNG